MKTIDSLYVRAGFTLALVLVWTLTPAALLSAPLQQVDIVIFNQPALLMEMYPDANALRESVRSYVVPGRRQFFLVGRRQGTWVGELPVEASADRRRAVLDDVLAEIRSASDDPIVSDDILDFTAEIVRRVQEDYAGDVAFNTHWVLGLQVGPSSSTESVGPIPCVPVKTPEPMKSSGMYPTLRQLLKYFGVFVAVIMCVIVAIRFRRRASDAEVGQAGGSEAEPPDPSADDVAADLFREPIRPPVPNLNHEPSPSRRITGFISVALICFALAHSALAQKLVFGDVSVSARSQTLDDVKSELARSALTGESAYLYAFGDSVISLGRISSLSQIDEAIATMPTHRTTRLTDAILFAMKEADRFRKEGGTPRVVFFSDFAPDENNNAALQFLPGRSTATNIVSDSSKSVIPGKVLSPTWMLGVLGSVGMLLFFGGFVVGRRRGKGARLEPPILSVTDGARAWDITLDELKDRPLQIVGRGLDAILPASINAIPTVHAEVEDGRVRLKVEQIYPGDQRRSSDAAIPPDPVHHVTYPLMKTRGSKNDDYRKSPSDPTTHDQTRPMKNLPGYRPLWRDEI